MGVTISNAARSAGADAIVDLLNAGSGPGKIRLYTASRPAGPGTAISGQTLLAEFTLNDPAFGSGVDGVKNLDNTPVPTATGLAAGTAAWFRALDSNNVAVLDGAVTATGGGGELEVNPTTVSVGLNLEITAGTITMPAGTV